ncbi:4-hydroxy-tetrahydrodipicolinate synthase [Pigmentiphaga humi]|uniref:4-hydroxy-tetrahydrodipicolinate synthase n=1 Tax=Pigmentiphaga humi TaxID=2478468 RepID=A0A3P4B6X6_9BURK|nr:dihydrodipicolinate synthase family protein [Pigmentiphaga humi]VCU71266.1 4-hydroxy-tetrahydrodipicolinate synthase [Pigmentiphaga humi]
MALELSALATRHYTTMVVPWNRDGELDEAALRRLVRYFAAHPRFRERGGIIANPDAGEIYYLSSAEKRRVLEITLEEAGGVMPVIAGVFDMTTAGCVREARIAKECGADGVFLMPPIGTGDLLISWDPVRYPEYWLDQIEAVDAAVGMPIITHPVTARSPQWGIGIPGETAQLICERVPNVIGWKMTYNYEGMRRMWRMLRSLERPVAIMAASGHLFHEFLSHDLLDGSVSGSWNYALEPMMQHIDCHQAGDLDGARQIWREGGLLALHEYIYSDYARLHLRYKLATWLHGVIPHYRMRPPLPRPKQAEIDTILRLLKTCDMQTIDAAQAVVEG